MRIIFLGASMTEGVYGGNFVKPAARLLPQHEIVNAGVGGSTINKLAERLDETLEQKPDAAFIMAGSNDAIAYSQPATRPYYKSTQGLAPDGYMTPEQFGAVYRDVLTRLQLAHVQPLIGLPPMEYNPTLVAASAAFNAQAEEVARAFNLPVLDLVALFNPPNVPERPPLDMKIIFTIGDRTKSRWNDYEAEQVKGGYTYSFDGIHLTPKSAEKMGELVAAFLKAELG